MKKVLMSLLFLLTSFFVYSQKVLVIEGTTINSSITGTWYGVNIERSVPTMFTYKNNSITSLNNMGYLLQAGDERPNTNNNHLDGEIITGNKFIWNGPENNNYITHGLFVGYNINWQLKYNYFYRVPTSIVLKSNGMTNVTGVVSYNIFISPVVEGIAVKGINNVRIYNNSFYSNVPVFSGTGKSGTQYGLVNILENDGITGSPSSTGTEIKNNIFYTKYGIPNICIENSSCLKGLVSDYNIFYCESGNPIFRVGGTKYTFLQWQTLGYDVHSKVINPNFMDFKNLVPKARLDYGTNLGVTWQKGLSINAIWGKGDSETVDQNGTWQVGAYVYKATVGIDDPPTIDPPKDSVTPGGWGCKRRY